MSVKLFVGGLSFTTSNDSLRAAFARYGAVASAAVMTDRETGRSRGFGFVEMATTEEAERALSSMNGANLDGRAIRVDKATPRGAGPRPGGFGGARPGGPGGGYAPRPAGGGYRGAGGGGFSPRPAPGGGFGDRRPAGGGGFAPRPAGGGGFGDRRPGGGFGAPQSPFGEGRGGNRRGPGGKGRGQGPGGDRPRRPGPKRRSDNQGGGGRGRLGTDGDYKFGR